MNLPDRTDLAKWFWSRDCVESDEVERREGRTPPEAWADPWRPDGTGARQQKRYYAEADALIAFLVAAPEPAPPQNDIRAMTDLFTERQIDDALKALPEPAQAVGLTDMIERLAQMAHGRRKHSGFVHRWDECGPPYKKDLREKVRAILTNSNWSGPDRADLVVKMADGLDAALRRVAELEAAVQATLDVYLTAPPQADYARLMREALQKMQAASGARLEGRTMREVRDPWLTEREADGG